MALFAGTLHAQYRFDNWTTAEGLPQNSVVDILQSHDSYLWFTTSDGLVRFDGVKFTVYNRETSPAMSSTRLTALYEDRSNDLWIGSEGDGLMRFRNGAFSVYGKETGLTSLGFRSGSIGHDGTGAMTVLQVEGVSRWKSGHFERIKTGVFPNNPVVDFPIIKWSDAAAYWSQGKETLAVFTAGKTLSWGRREGLPDIEVLAVGEDEIGTLWLGGVGTLLRRDGDTLRQAPLPQGCLTSEDFSFVRGRRLELVCRGQDGSLLVSQPDGSNLETMPHCPIPRSSRLSDMRLYRDREGILWIGTSGAGLFSVRRQAITTISDAQGLRDHNIYPIYQDRSDAIWFGAWPLTLTRLAQGRFEHFSLKDGLSANVSALFQDRSGRLWVGAYSPLGDGLRILDHGGFIPPPAPLRKMGVVRTIFQDRAGALWFGTQDKLVRYLDGATRVFTTSDGLASNFVAVIAEDRHGNLWIGGAGGLSRYTGDRFHAYTARDGLPDGFVRALYEDPQGILWIGTYDGGIVRYDGSRFVNISRKDGLFSNGVFQILEDRNGFLWMSSNQGIYRVKKQDLNDFATRKIGAINSIAYAKRDGMLSEECNGGHWPAGVRTRDGKMWFPTQNGIAVVDPESVPISSEPPNVNIESVSADFKAISLGSSVKLKPAQRNFEIQYTALSLIAPERIRFRYKLEGVDDDWVNAGSRRTAYYSHAPHGSFTFRVIAANRDGVWNTEGSSLRVDILPYFYETWWFSTACAFLGAGILFGIWWRHSARLQEAFASQQAFTHQLIARQESERQRIAAELHDSIGQRLAIIKNLTMMFAGSRENGTAQSQLEEICSESSQAMSEIRDIAYNLRPFQLDHLGLTKAIEAVVKRASQVSGIAFSAALDDLQGFFPHESEIALFRIAQEAIANILKHSSATQAEVSAISADGKMTLRIHDNGKGFPHAFKMGDPFPDGFGLRGLSERADILGGRISIESMPGDGTSLRIEFDSQRQKHVRRGANGY